MQKRLNIDIINTRLVLATSNQGKLKELRALLAENRIEIATLRDFPELTMPEETGQTFIENARLKALAVVAATGCWALSDDSGLVVEALAGAPGIYSARYAGIQASDTDNNRKLLQELATVPNEKRQAAFVCVMVLASPARDEYVFEGSCRGRIAQVPTGTEGFGYDPIFLPAPDYNVSMAELSLAAKNAISHRGQALQQLKHWINS
jgi:XTP/dITP diphosphohydrolase